jgi:hypothetical protein
LEVTKQKNNCKDCGGKGFTNTGKPSVIPLFPFGVNLLKHLK